MKLYKSIFISFIFICVLLSTYYFHVVYLKVNVVFYSAITDGVVATGIVAIILLSFKLFSEFNWFEKTQLIVIWLLASYIFAISIPTVLDRSLSFYILEKLQQRGGGIQLAKFEDVFTEEYLKEHRLVDVRLTEQQQSGTIIIENGCVKLTERGVRLASFSRYFRRNFLPKQRLLMGGYSDELTDPFRNSQEKLDYSCN